MKNVVRKNKEVKITKWQKNILSFTLVYIFIFAVLTILQKNYEFIIYLIGMAILIPIIWKIHLKFNFSIGVLAGLSILGFVHMLGGLVIIDGVRLYGSYLIEDILRIDKVVHTFGILIATLGIYTVLEKYLKVEKKFVLYLFTILMSVGIGALWEIFEFIPVMTLPSTGVGRYFNTMGDLIADTLGAVLAVNYINFKNRRKA